MDIRHFDPAHATEVTHELAEDRPEENRLFRIGGCVYKAKSFWLPDAPALAGQRGFECTVSLCDDRGQAQRDDAGGLIVSERRVLKVTAGLAKSADEQADEAIRQWVVAFHHARLFWDVALPGVAKRPPPPEPEAPAIDPADVAWDVDAA